MCPARHAKAGGSPFAFSIGPEYEGRRFQSLSHRQAVTGVHWNGLLFLTGSGRRREAEAGDEERSERSRPFRTLQVSSTAGRAPERAFRRSRCANPIWYSNSRRTIGHSEEGRPLRAAASRCCTRRNRGTSHLRLQARCLLAETRWCAETSANRSASSKAHNWVITQEDPTASGLQPNLGIAAFTRKSPEGRRPSSWMPNAVCEATSLPEDRARSPGSLRRRRFTGGHGPAARDCWSTSRPKRPTAWRSTGDRSPLAASPA
jgi:hypothetical protein